MPPALLYLLAEGILNSFLFITMIDTHLFLKFLEDECSGDKSQVLCKYFSSWLSNGNLFMTTTIAIFALLILLSQVNALMCCVTAPFNNLSVTFCHLTVWWYQHSWNRARQIQVCLRCYQGAQESYLVDEDCVKSTRIEDVLCKQ